MERVQVAEFAERTRCVNCASSRLSELSRGKFTEPPLLGFIEGDPWGESPLPYLGDSEWVFVRCLECGQRFHERVLTDEWNERRFSKWMTAEAIREYEARLGDGGDSFLHRFNRGREHVSHVLRIEKHTRSIREPGERVRLLDFGCGSGDFLLACMHVGGFDAVGIDRAAPRREISPVTILEKLDDLDGARPFHAITLFEVLEHLVDPAAVLGRLVTLLAPGGLLVLETPDCTNVSGIRTVEDYRAIHPLDHINAFTHDTLTSIAERQGLMSTSKSVAHVTADHVPLIKAEARHLLQRDRSSTRLYFRKPDAEAQDLRRSGRGAWRQALDFTEFARAHKLLPAGHGESGAHPRK